jgi:2-polyprenyl-3-methyl-5-hydroxy-6-metoxy-1,4-benzoquinol methylase
LKKKNPLGCEICKMNYSLQFIGFGVISPWIRELAGISFKHRSKLFFCTNCKSGFFSYRYSPPQLYLIYSKYRSDLYNGIRNRWEKWYSLEYALGHGDVELILKRNHLVKTFLDDAGAENLESILDVGGDRGQFLAEYKAKKKVILEMSHHSLEKGVTRIDTLIDSDRFDLIQYCHVLEHVAEPLLELKTLLRHTNLIYVEVPNGVPLSSRSRRSFLRFHIFNFISLNPYGWRLLTKPAAGRGHVNQVLRQSEHINFFSEDSFKVIAKMLNVNVKTAITLIPTPDGSVAEVIQVLLEKS